MILFDFNPKTRRAIVKIDDSVLFNRVREHFSVENKGAFFARQKNKFIPQRKYVITPLGACEAGLIGEIRSHLIELQVVDEVIYSEALTNYIESYKKPGIEVFTRLNPSLREYQYDVIRKGLDQGRGVCVLGTGAGKTLTTAALIESYFQESANKDTFKCLLIVPDLGLVAQTHKEFIQYGVSFKLTTWTGKHIPDLTSNVIICNIGILQSRFEENEWVKFVDLLIVDEAHKIKSSNKISKIVTQVKTPHTYGFTGTLPEDQIDKWSIVGKFGPVLYEKSSYELRNEDFLVNVVVKCLDINYKSKPRRLSKNAYRDELEFINTNEFRNNLIYTLCERINNNTLVLVNYIKHGQLLFDTLSKMNKQVFFIRGEVEVVERDKIKQIMEDNNDVVCIAISAIFSTGINIKNLHNIIFAAGGKSFVRTVQSIGRGLRKHQNKERLVIFDICDNLTYSAEHGQSRMAIYEKEKIKASIKSITQT